MEASTFDEHGCSDTGSIQELVKAEPKMKSASQERHRFVAVLAFMGVDWAIAWQKQLRLGRDDPMRGFVSPSSMLRSGHQGAPQRERDFKCCNNTVISGVGNMPQLKIKRRCWVSIS